jgi:hypothetical protein
MCERRGGQWQERPMAPATMIDREPKRPQQVMLIGDTARRHHDGRNRVIHDLFLRRNRDAPRLAATPQLPDQLSATPMQLRRNKISIRLCQRDSAGHSSSFRFR